MNLNLRRWFLGIAVGYVIILCGLVYWHLCPSLADHPADPRSYLVFQQARGPIYDRHGKPLAWSAPHGEGFKRIYSTPSLSHVVGYFHHRYGSTGLERLYHEDLLQGREVWTTLDLDLQILAEKALGDKLGAAVVLNPISGEVLALVSSPSIDGNKLESLWSEYLADQRSPFVNRALQGLYPPGSLVKPLVYGKSLAAGLAGPDTLWDDHGLLIIQDRTLHNFGNRVLGVISTKEALAYSSNVVFASLAMDLEENLLTCLTSFGLGSALPFELENQSGSVPSSVNSRYELAQLGIGQGKLLVTPLQMGVAAAALANRGQMMKPYLVREIKGGFQLRRITRPEILGQVLPEQTALQVRDGMVLAALEGTARPAAVSGLDFGGKTGTAQVGARSDHAWFIGFAPSYLPQAAVAVLVEHGGSGGMVAAPIGAELLAAALDGLDSKKGKR